MAFLASQTMLYLIEISSDLYNVYQNAQFVDVIAEIVYWEGYLAASVPAVAWAICTLHVAHSAAMGAQFAAGC